MWAKTPWDWRLGVKLKMKWPVGKDGFHFILCFQITPSFAPSERYVKAHKDPHVS